MKNSESTPRNSGHELSNQEVIEAIRRGLSYPEGLEKDVYGDTAEDQPSPTKPSDAEWEAATVVSAPAAADGWVTLSLPPRPEDPMAK